MPQAEGANPELLTLPDDLAVLDEAARTSLEVLKADIAKLDLKTWAVTMEIGLPRVPSR